MHCVLCAVRMSYISAHDRVMYMTGSVHTTSIVTGSVHTTSIVRTIISYFVGACCPVGTYRYASLNKVCISGHWRKAALC